MVTVESQTEVAQSSRQGASGTGTRRAWLAVGGRYNDRPWRSRRMREAEPVPTAVLTFGRWWSGVGTMQDLYTHKSTIEALWKPLSRRGQTDMDGLGRWCFAALRPEMPVHAGIVPHAVAAPERLTNVVGRRRRATSRKASCGS